MTNNETYGNTNPEGQKLKKTLELLNRYTRRFRIDLFESYNVFMLKTAIQDYDLKDMQVLKTAYIFSNIQPSKKQIEYFNQHLEAIRKSSDYWQYPCFVLAFGCITCVICELIFHIHTDHLTSVLDMIPLLYWVAGIMGLLFLGIVDYVIKNSGDYQYDTLPLISKSTIERIKIDQGNLIIKQLTEEIKQYNKLFTKTPNTGSSVDKIITSLTKLDSFKPLNQAQKDKLKELVGTMTINFNDHKENSISTLYQKLTITHEESKLKKKQ
ncbi:MAG: hypothetical protein CMF42_05965 [Legionellales bacterium]|nr:hypothetical protein [Legionellales bacterium]OUX66957.1 MAG: hypothetical protein CBD38_04310 [bacterium TMED178]|tara:strand:- start:7774 stop:8577 length:804 start_codon:yes stop_codon:yes gene_type:complete